MKEIEKAIEIEGLSYSYPDGTQALEGLNLALDSQKKLAILGANGSGKSTLLQHLNGLILAQSGQVKIRGKKIEKANLVEIRKTIGLVFDNPDNQLFSTTVFEDVAFGPRNLRLEETRVKKLVNQVLDLIGIGALRDKAPHNLSLGQKRKASIAGVLAMEPDILIFDEPFSGLDPESLDQFLGILDQLANLGKTLVVTTHDVDIAYTWADEIIIIDQGKLLAQGSIELLEDETLLNQANLKLPSLYEIFRDTDLRVRSLNQARSVINEMYLGRKQDE